jgi:ABC-type branched-subunit amino acid transport system ATPase component/ABC-type branched-subunit amino acid transport system permease subunit
MSERARGWLGITGVLAVGLLLSFVLTERYHHRILTLVFLWAAMGLAWNIISGYAGQISFGHQAFFGIGAYTTVLLAAKLKLTPWLGMFAGAGVAVLAALLIGTPTFRLAGIYFGLATLAYPLIFRIVMDYLGFQEVAIPMVRDHPVLFMQFEEPRSFDLLALALLGATLVLSRLIEGSRLGYSLRAIKENEQAALAMGVDAFRCKMAAYALSAAPAALAGAIYAHAILFVVTPEAVFGVLVIVQTLVVCLVGGVGTLWGPVIGAAIMIPVSEILDGTVGDRLPGIQGVVYGAALMAIMMFAPEGLFWRLRRRRAPAAVATATGAAPADREREAAPPAVVPGAVLLDVRGVSKAFLGLQALSEVSFDVRQGEILGIIGPNGSGKSTLFNCILGQLRPSAGAVRLDGRDVTGMRPSDLNRLGISRTFQLLQVFPQLSVRENLILAGQEHQGSMATRLFGPPDAGLTEAADRMIGFFKLSHLADEKAGGLSYGQQKLLDAAMAFMAGPRLVLLDEPAGGVNLTMLASLKERLQAINAEQGATLVVIEHNMEFVMSLCTRVLVLAEGKVLAEGPPEAVRNDPKVIEAYLGH